nr:acetyl-coenzyme A carboxylase carboxyl transferase subunit alpha, chloroplastic-like [Tanacetum cinerariifolium]
MGERAAESREMAKENYIVMHLDLSSFDSFRQFVGKIKQSVGLSIKKTHHHWHNNMTTFCLKVPINTIVASEGGSGGALAIRCVNRMFVLENVAFCVAPGVSNRFAVKSAGERSVEFKTPEANSTLNMEVSFGHLPQTQVDI